MGWVVRRLEDYLERAKASSPSAKSRSQDPSLPVYGSGGVAKSHDVALAEGPALIIGRKGTVGSLLYPEARSGFPIDTVFYTLARIGSMLFSYHLLALLARQPLRTMNTDATIPGLNRSNVCRLQFPCPTLGLISVFDIMVGYFGNRQVANLDESGALVRLRDFLLPKLVGGGLRMFSKLDANEMGAA